MLFHYNLELTFCKTDSKTKMGCPALGIWVGFLKQPALPGEAPPQKKSSKIIRKNKIRKFFKKATQIPKAGHPILSFYVPAIPNPDLVKKKKWRIFEIL
jgi:hypothetical protein